MSTTSVPSQETIDQFVGNAHGNFSVVKELLGKYPSMINANASWTETAIQAAAQIGQVEIVNYLLAHGADYDICTAAMLGSRTCIDEFLIENPGAISARSAHGIPLLYFPIIRGNAEIAEYLLQRGADINAASPGGITPLHGAVMFDQVKMAEWLLEHGADPNTKYENKTPLAIAVEKDRTEMAEVLRSHGGVE